jgi:hypothetical protein
MDARFIQELMLKYGKNTTLEETYHRLNGSYHTCVKCKGSCRQEAKYQSIQYCTGESNVKHYDKCELCGGSGWTIDKFEAVTKTVTTGFKKL